MKKIIVFLVLTLTLSVPAQNRAEIISVMNAYTQNYGKPNYSFAFVDHRLNPALLKIEKLVCENNDSALFDCFIEMVLITKGSANEVPSEVLGGIFICQPEFVEKRLTEKYKDRFLLNLLEFGFGNRTYDRKKEIANYAALEERLKRLLR